MLLLASSVDEIDCTFHCLNADAQRRIDVMQLSNSSTVLVPGASTGGSMGHGLCVNSALATANDDDAMIIVDSDTVTLARRWDVLVRHAFDVLGYDCIGTTYEGIGGFSSGDGNVQTYKDLPNFVWMGLAPGSVWRSFDACPEKDKTLIVTEDTSDVYNLPPFTRILCDVGWRIPQFLNQHEMKSHGWYQRKPTKDAVVLAGLTDYHEEYHVDYLSDAQRPFVVHHRGSLRHPYRGSNMSSMFYDRVDNYVAKQLTTTL